MSLVFLSKAGTTRHRVNTRSLLLSILSLKSFSVVIRKSLFSPTGDRLVVRNRRTNRRTRRGCFMLRRYENQINKRIFKWTTNGKMIPDLFLRKVSTLCCYCFLLPCIVRCRQLGRKEWVG